MPNQTNNEELYYQIERNLTNFKNLKITYTEFIDWTISKIQAAEKRGKREGLEEAKQIIIKEMKNALVSGNLDDWHPTFKIDQAIKKLNQ